MVDSIRPINYARLNPANSRVPESGDVESKADEKEAEPYVVTKERRKNRDRRRDRQSRGAYELRSGRDRRKGFDQGSVEIKV